MNDGNFSHVSSFKKEDWENFPMSPLSKRKNGNKCSVGPETSICPRGKGQGPTSFSERGLFFSEIWTASQGLTVRPRLDSPDRGKEQSSRGKGGGRDLFYSRIYLFHALQIHFFYLSNVMTPTMRS